jgi:hypothetical protein
LIIDYSSDRKAREWAVGGAFAFLEPNTDMLKR